MFLPHLSDREDTPAPLELSSRGSYIHEKAREILDKVSSTEKEMEAFDNFSSKVVTYLRTRVKSTADKVKSNSRKRQRLWTDFHEMATSESTLSLLWQEMITNLGIDGIEDPLLEHGIEDPLLEQSLYNEIHQRIVKDYFEEGAEFSGPVTKSKIENISSDELNIL